MMQEHLYLPRQYIVETRHRAVYECFADGRSELGDGDKNWMVTCGILPYCPT